MRVSTQQAARCMGHRTHRESLITLNHSLSITHSRSRRAARRTGTRPPPAPPRPAAPPAGSTPVRGSAVRIYRDRSVRKQPIMCSFKKKTTGSCSRLSTTQIYMAILRQYVFTCTEYMPDLFHALARAGLGHARLAVNCCWSAPVLA